MPKIKIRIINADFFTRIWQALICFPGGAMLARRILSCYDKVSFMDMTGFSPFEIIYKDIWSKQSPNQELLSR